MTSHTFKTRRVGGTSLEVTELGIGTATFPGQLGIEIPEAEARATLDAAIEAGVGYFDTAPMYGFGMSEHYVGNALRFRQEGRVISTKVGRLLRPVRSDAERKTPNPWTRSFPFEHVYDYSYDGVMRSYEDSLQRLGLAKVDILLVHDIGVRTHGEDANKHYWKQLVDGGYRALTELKARGDVSAIGLGVNEWPVLMDAFGIGEWDVFLLANRYTLLEQEVLDPFLTTCARRGTSLIAAGPFAAGILAGTDIWGPNDGRYQKAPPEVVARVQKLQTVCKQFGVPLGAAALQFALAHPVVCTVLTGPKSRQEFDGILAWWNTQIPRDFWQALSDQGLVAEGTPLPGGIVAG
jgi:D-threo-aldose 1-dehydrogenase